MGCDKTISMVKALYFWPHLKCDIGKFIKRCYTCQTTMGQAQNTKLYIRILIPDAP